MNRLTLTLNRHAVSHALVAAAGIAVAVAWAVWRGRVTWRAPREQQREAEAELLAEAPRAG